MPALGEAEALDVGDQPEVSVLVGCPTSDSHAYCLREYVEGVKRLTYPRHEVLLVDNSEGEGYRTRIEEAGLPAIRSPFCEAARERIVKARNALRQRALEHGFDYFLSLEQDVIPPPDVIERLLRHGKEVVSGVYYTLLGDRLSPVAYRDSATPGRRQLVALEEVEASRLMPVVQTGLGCLLIHRSVLKKVEFRYEKEDALERFDDFWFCQDATQQGFQLFLDTGVKCRHLFVKRPWRWSELKK